jgi:cytochrome b subunit of formate dehydrogenase
MELKVPTFSLMGIILAVVLFLGEGVSWTAETAPGKEIPLPEAGIKISPSERTFEVNGKVYPYNYAFIANPVCLSCHTDKIDQAKYALSAHADNSCNSCHFEITNVETHVHEVEIAQQGRLKKEIPVKPVHCLRCHQKQSIEFHASTHFTSEMECIDCHRHIHQFTLWKKDRKRIIQTCTLCHATSPPAKKFHGKECKIAHHYPESVHGQAALKGNPDAPVCTDCHGQDQTLHQIPGFQGKTAKVQEFSKIFHTSACAACHADRAKMKRNKVSLISTETYYEGYHGKIEKLGYPALAAGCSDCHSRHDILPSKNPKSSTFPANLVKTCGKCHKGANANFVQYDSHPNYKDPRKTFLYWPFLFMTTLTVSVFGAFWVHSFLWWRKEFWEERALRSEGIFFASQTRGKEGGEVYRRFGLFGIALHLTMLTSFLGLVLSGLPLEFANAPWARGLMGFLGGAHKAGLFHRICAGVTLGYFGTAVGYMIYFLFFKPLPGSPSFWQRFFGPDSIFPRRKDFSDFAGMVRWFFNKGPKPHFDRWTYYQKFDFMAVFWGVFVIGISGLMLWFPVFFTTFLPGWLLNVAKLVHSDEALLAVGFIFTVHFFNNHFRPSRFPISTVIFTGRLTKTELETDLPAWHDRMSKEGTLEAHRAKPPGVWTDFYAEVVGFTMLGIGILCIFLIGWRFLGSPGSF